MNKIEKKVFDQSNQQDTVRVFTKNTDRQTQISIQYCRDTW